MEVKLRNPDRSVDVSGPRTVEALLRDLEIVPESVLVIRDAVLLTRDEMLQDADVVEVRPVLSGGASVTSCAIAEPIVLAPGPGSP